MVTGFERSLTADASREHSCGSAALLGEVVFSTFSANDGFSAGVLGLNNATDIAVSFVPRKDFTLDSVRVAVTHVFGPNDYIIHVTEDSCGQPSATPLESLTGLFFPEGFPGIFTPNSLTNPVLAAGHTYWIWLTSNATDPFALNWHQNELNPLASGHSSSVRGGLGLSSQMATNPRLT